MFRFYCSDWKSDLKWRATDAPSFEAVVERYHRANNWVTDADNDGEGESYFAVKSKCGDLRHFHLKYEWVTFYSDEEHVRNEWTVTEIETSPVHIPGDRDWLIIPGQVNVRGVPSAENA